MEFAKTAIPQRLLVLIQPEIGNLTRRILRRESLQQSGHLAIGWKPAHCAPASIGETPIRKFHQELRQPTALTRVQLAEVHSATFETINCRGDRDIQPLPLLLPQIKLFIDKITHFSVNTLQAGGNHLSVRSTSPERLGT